MSTSGRDRARQHDSRVDWSRVGRAVHYAELELGQRFHGDDDGLAHHGPLRRARDVTVGPRVR